MSQKISQISLFVALVFVAPTLAVAHAGDLSVDRTTEEALALDANPGRGKSLYARHCVQCHGTQGYGDAARAIPALAGQRFTYLVRQQANFAGEERDGRAMQHVLSQPALREPQAWVDLASYLARVPIGTGLAIGDGTHVVVGRAIFLKECAGCHFLDARGDGAGFVPSLRNQHYTYLLNQMQRMGSNSRHNVDEDLLRFLGDFTDRDMRATADYLSRLEGQAEKHSIMRPNGVVVD